MTDQVVARLVTETIARDAGTEQLLRRLEARLKQVEATAQKAGKGVGDGIGAGAAKATTGMRALEAAEARGAIQTARVQQAQANASAALTRRAASEQNLAAATARREASESRAAAAAARTEIAQRRAAAAAGQTTSAYSQLSNSVGQLNQLAAGAGIAVGVQQIASFAGEAANASLSLTRVQTALRQLAGGQEQYNAVLATAREQQRLFGGTLEDNLSDLTAFTVLARSSGAELNSLVDLGQRLATFDPGQGIRGASLALRELLAGNPASLAARFELPKAALAGIRDESATTTDRLRILNDVLNQAGITSDLVASSIPAGTLALNSFGAAADNAKVAIGNLVQQGLTPLAQFGTTILNQVASGLSNLANAGAGVQQLNASLLAGAATYDQYLARQKESATQLRTVGVVLPQLSAAQFAYAQSLMQTGTSAEAAIAAAVQLTGVLNQLAATQQAIQVSTGESNVAFDALAQRLLAVAQTGSAQAATVQALFAGFQSGAVDIDQLTQATQQLEQAQQAAADAAATEAVETERLSRTSQEAAVAVDAQTKAIGEQLVAAQEAADRTKALEDANKQIAGIAGQVVSGLLSMADAAAALAAQYGITEAAARSLIAAQAGVQVQEKFQNQRNQRERQQSGGGRGGQLSNSGAAFVEQRKAEAEAAAEARARANRKGRGGGGGGGGRVSAAAKEQEKLLKGQEDFSNKSEDLEAEHQQKLAEIAAEGARKIAAEQAAFNQEQLDGRASFYERLGDIEDAGVQQALSAKYEQAVAEANRIGQEKGPDAAREFLKASEQAIDEEAGLEQKIREANDKGDTARAEYFKGVLALRQSANAAELDSIRNAGSQIANEQAAQYAAAEQEYAAHLDRMGLIYTRKFGVQPPGAGGTPAGLPPPSATLPPAPATTTTPLADTGAAAAAKPTSAAQLVTDPGTQDAIDALGARLEGKIDSLGTKIDAVEKRTGAVESAVRSLKSGIFKGD